ncbi:hypothetical protein D6D22_09595 [Aureobasidium pullulans]|uniref:NAD(P)-binding protein n=1 Tax=Aureobasidium pullulans TaxID=5580 RepID=A0A4S8X514_AURPU|nr:hypothetical protein D6D22_09595 [Aureobasidium pullulans]
MAEIYTNETPQEVKEAKGLHLLTQSTPNGQKVQIMLEELAAVYGTTWTTTLIDISTNEQKKDWYLRLNPNGRIPTIVDNTKDRPFPVMETSAELLYLVKKFDKDGLFTFDDELEYSQMLQWLFFWHGSGAPYQGQLGFFSRAAEKVPMAIERFRNETLRVFGVLEIQLSGKYSDGPREYLAGAGKGKYSIADIGTWTWTSKWNLGGFKEEDMNAQFPHLLKWISRIGERDAVKIGTGSKAVTRDNSKPSAKALAEKGAELVNADLNSKESVPKIIQGSHTVFLVTNYWETMDPKVEVTQGKNVAHAAKEAGVSHIIFSSLLNVTEATNGRLVHVPHFDGKADIEKHIRSTGVPCIFMHPGYFMSNLTDMMQKGEDGSFTLAYPTSDEAKFPLFDAAQDTGDLSTVSEATRKSTHFASVTPEQYKSFLPEAIAEEMLENHLFVEKPDYYNGAELDESLSILEGPQLLGRILSSVIAIQRTWDSSIEFESQASPNRPNCSALGA